MIHDAKYIAIGITAIFLEAGYDYKYADAELYMLQGADGTDFVFSHPEGRMIFAYSVDAADAFANYIWRKYV